MRVTGKNWFKKYSILLMLLAMGCSSSRPVKPVSAPSPESYLSFDRRFGEVAELMARTAHSPMGTLAVAVPDLASPDALPQGFRQFLAERMIHALARQSRFTPIERRQFYKIVQELRLEYSQLFDPVTRQQLQMKGVDALVVGEIFVRENQLEIFLRLVVLRTGLVVSSHLVTVPRDEDLIRSFQ